MLKLSWLNNLRNQFTASKSACRSRKISTVSVYTEQLDARQMLSATPAIAIGSQAQVNTTTTGDQVSPAIAMDSSGDYVVAWQSADGSGVGIFAQRFNHYGVAQGGEFQVNSITTGDQSQPTIAIDSSGDFVVGWASSDGDGMGVWARRFNSSGVAQGAEFLVNTYTTHDQQYPSVGMDPAGDFVLTWESTQQSPDYYQSIPDGGIYAQRYNAAGTKVGSEFLVNDTTNGNFHAPSVSMNASGQFLIVWTGVDYPGFSDPFPHVSAKRYEANGSVSFDEDEFMSGYHGQMNAQGALNSSGNFAATFWGYWNDNLDDPSTGGVRALMNGQNSFTSVNTYQTGTQSFPKIAVGGNGDFVITWQSQNEDGSGDGIYKQEYDSNFNPVGGETRVNAFTTGGQGSPAVAADANGDYVIVWQGSGQDTSGSGIYSQAFFAPATTQGPMLLQLEGTTIIAPGMLSVPLTSSLNVYDGQATQWTGATVQISSNYQNGQDVLSFTNTAKITGNFDASTGKLTLTGTDSVSNYRAALRSITYHNTSSSPNTALTRTISFQAMDAISSSNVLTRKLVVQATSSPPTVTGLGATVTYVSPTAPIAIAPSVMVADPANLNIQSATVTITNWQTEDRLAFTNLYGLAHTFSIYNTTATLTISGSATAAQYQALLRTVTYQDVAGVPNTSAVRAATIAVQDSLHSGSATTNISVIRYVSGLSTTPVHFSQGAPPMVLAPNLVLQPPAGVGNINKATVSFINWQAEDRLAFTNTIGLGISYSIVQNLNAHTATLTVQGTASVAQYQALLRTVTYQDVAGNVNTTTRITTFTVMDGTNTGTASESVNVTVTNQPPVVNVNASNQLTYKVNSTSIAIMNMALITDPDSANLSSLTIQISSGYQNGHDVFGYSNFQGITFAFNAATGTLTLSGAASVSNYRQALRGVTFHTVGSGVSTATRVFKVIATDSTNTPSAPVTRSLTVTQ